MAPILSGPDQIGRKKDRSRLYSLCKAGVRVWRKRELEEKTIDRECTTHILENKETKEIKTEKNEIGFCEQQRCRMASESQNAQR